MEDILPQTVLNTIRDRYYSGVTAAENGYKYNRADEDAVTGALGQALLSEPTLVTDRFGRSFTYSMYHTKIRGRGRGAPEKNIGADGIFQIEIHDENGKLLRRKGLLFQAKKEWNGADSLLGQQAETLLCEGKNQKAVVIDYSPNGYRTCDVLSAAETGGNSNRIDDEKFANLSTTLGDEFLLCRVGIIDMHYDNEREILYDPTTRLQHNLDKKHIIGTQIQLLN